MPPLAAVLPFPRVSGFHEVDFAVAAPDQYANPVGLRVAIGDVVLAAFERHHGLIHGHGLAAILRSLNYLSRLLRFTRLFFRWSLGCLGRFGGLRRFRLHRFGLSLASGPRLARRRFPL